MSAQPTPRLTVEQYLELDRTSELKHEFFRGHMYAMSGGTHRHAMIILNFGGELRAALKRTPCKVSASDSRVRIAPDGLYTYPDIVVVCDEPKFVDGKRDTIENPVLVIEVLSPSTEAYDRGFKSAQYRTLESLKEYALVSQAEPRVEVFRRQADHTWVLSESVGLNAACRLDSVACSVPLAEIYDKINFEDAE